MQQNKAEWEQAVEDLDTTIKNSSGLYETKEVQSDDESLIYYFHDKPLLDESQLVIKIAKDAIGISNTGKDGLYDVGINTVTGTAVLKEIYTIGLNADCIKTGSLSANRIKGGILKVGGQNNGYGEIEVYNSNDVLVGSWKNTSFETYSANFTGNITIGNKTLQDKYWIEIDGVDNRYLGKKIRFYANDPSNNSSTYDFTIGMQEDDSGVIGATFDLNNRAKFIGINGANYRSFWYQRTAESHSTLGEIEADTINSSVNFDMHGNAIENVSFSGNVSFLNNTNIDYYSNINMHNFGIENLRINNIVGVGSQDKQPITATFPYVKTITENADGGIDWTYGDLTFENGILVGY